MSRRQFLICGCVATGGLALGACTGRTDYAPTPTPSTSEAQAVGDLWGTLREVRAAVRASPDHLVQRAEDLVAAGDAEAILQFVRDAIAAHPPRISGWGGVEAAVRWGPRGTLRGGTGTPREKADLLYHLLTQAGFNAELRKLREERTVTTATSPVAIFAPDISEDRLDQLTSALGAPSFAADVDVDPGGRSSAELANSLLTTLGQEEAISTVPFADVPVGELPTVAITVDDELLVADLWGDSDFVPADELETSSLGSETPPTITVRFQAVATAAPRELITLVEGTWEVDQLVGRRVEALLAPAASTLDELLAVSPASVTTFIPVLSLSGSDVDTAERAELNAVGHAITSAGQVIVEDPNTGSLRLGQSELSGDGDPAEVATVELGTIRAGGFPSVTVEVSALDQDGQNVEDLPASAFELHEEGTPRPFVVERSKAPPPRLLFLLDTSSSIPDEFKGEAYASSIRTIGERLLEAQPRVQFRIATVSFDDAEDETDWTADLDALVQAATNAEGFGSNLWDALGDAGQYGPTAIVFVTDGRATTEGTSSELLEAPSATQRAAVARGAPALVVGVGDEINPEMLELLASASAGEAFTVLDSDDLVEAVSERLVDRAVPPYRIRWVAPVEGLTERKVVVSCPTANASDKGTYRTPRTEEQALPEGIIGLYLEVEAGRVKSRRHLAGLLDESDVIGGDPPTITPTLVEEARRALFGQYVLAVEPSPPTMAHILDDLLTARMSHEAVVIADDDDARRRAIEAGYVTVLPNLWDVAAPLLADPSLPVTYEIGPRMWIQSTRIVPGAGNDAVRRTVDVLPHTRFATAEADPAAQLRATARQSLRLALAEKAFYDSSTASLLAGESLVASSSIRQDLPDANPGNIGRLVRAARNWPWRGPSIVPSDGDPTALWAIDEETGSVSGLLADGTGGGNEVAEINATFDQAASMLDTVNKLGDLSKFFGGPGLSFGFGVWADIEKTKLEKLRAATIMLATLEEPASDISDLSDLADALGEKVTEKGVEILLPHLIGTAAAEDVLHLKDARKAWEAITGLLGVGAS